MGASTKQGGLEMTGRLRGKVALVTGGSRGIGKACALAFAREGANVVVADILISEGEDTVGMINKGADKAIFVKADVTKAVEVEMLINKAVEKYGRLDCAFNNAGILGANVLISECTEENWQNVVAVNLKGVWLCMKYELLQMVKCGGGAIVNTASVFGLVGAVNRAAYVASKHGVVGLTKVAALEFAKGNMRVNAVCPGPIRTPLVDRAIADDPQRETWLLERVPMGHLGTAPEVAEVVVWLCSDASSFVTGLIMAVDGGYTAQ